MNSNGSPKYLNTEDRIIWQTEQNELADLQRFTDYGYEYSEPSPFSKALRTAKDSLVRIIESLKTRPRRQQALSNFALQHNVD